MPELEEKAKKRSFSDKPVVFHDKAVPSEKRKPMKLIIGTADHSTSSFVKAQTIKLDPKYGPRGTGPGSREISLTIGSKVPPSATTGRTISVSSQRRQ